MHIHLTERLTLAVESDDSAVARYAAHWLAGCATAAPLSAPTITLRVVVGELPPPPAELPFFTDTRFQNIYQYGNLSVYHQPEGLLLWFARGGAVHLRHAAPNCAEVRATPQMVASGRFEDMLLVTLAYFLRRHNHYFVHAFAAAVGEMGLLVLGGTGSGKTTTGLNCLLAGGRLLANDAPMLTEQAGHILALPTPGLLSIRPGSFGLLPELAGWLGMKSVPEKQVWLASDRVAWGTAVPIHQLLFARVAPSPTSWLEPIPRALALAHLLEESVDQWDTATNTAHITLLERLVQQATPHTLHLGRDMGQMRELLAGVEGRFRVDAEEQGGRGAGESG